MKKTLDDQGERLIHLVTRAKSNVVAYLDPPSKTGRPGRPGGAPWGPRQNGYVSSISNQSDSIMNTFAAVSASNNIRTSNTAGTSSIDAFGKVLGVASTATGALEDASEIWNIGVGLKLKYAMPSGYTEAFVNSGGRLAPLMTQPALIGAEFSTGSKFLKNADLAMNLQSVGKSVKPAAGLKQEGRLFS